MIVDQKTDAVIAQNKNEERVQAMQVLSTTDYLIRRMQNYCVAEWKHVATVRELIKREDSPVRRQY